MPGTMFDEGEYGDDTSETLDAEALLDVELTPDAADTRVALLTALVDAGGPLGTLAAEALALMTEREAQVKFVTDQVVLAETLTADALASLLNRFNQAVRDGDGAAAAVWSAAIDEAKEAARWAVLVDREAADILFLENMEKSLRAQDRDEAWIASELATLRQQLADDYAIAEASGNDVLTDSQVFYDAEILVHEQAAAEMTAQRMRDADPRSEAEELSEAQEFMDAVVARTLAGSFAGPESGGDEAGGEDVG